MSGPAARKRSTGLAVTLAATGACLSAVDAVLVRSLNGEVHPFVIAFFRAAFGALTILPIVVRNPHVLVSVYPLHQHTVRAGLKLLALAAFFAAFAKGPLTDVTAVAFTSPIFVLVGAALAFGEKLGPTRIAALLFGFAGAMLVVSPVGSGLSLAIGFAFAGALLQALIQLMLKSMSSGDRTDTLVCLNLLLTVPMAAVLAAMFWTTPTWHQFGLLTLQGVLGAICMSAMTHAFSLADASVVAPVDFARLPMVAAFAYAVFGEVAGIATWIGGTMICFAVLLAARPLRRTTKQP
ncbi:DMT family transporter [Rhizobium cremeum]|uniref:DMT family transporter n=1 Tax=Rhizobium cremeum TaxID=2813827 RepID=UPI000DDF199B